MAPYAMNKWDVRLFGPEPAKDIKPSSNLIGGSNCGSSKIVSLPYFLRFSLYVIPNWTRKLGTVLKK